MIEFLWSGDDPNLWGKNAKPTKSCIDFLKNALKRSKQNLFLVRTAGFSLVHRECLTDQFFSFLFFSFKAQVSSSLVPVKQKHSSNRPESPGGSMPTKKRRYFYTLSSLNICYHPVKILSFFPALNFLFFSLVVEEKLVAAASCFFFPGAPQDGCVPLHAWNHSNSVASFSFFPRSLCEHVEASWASCAEVLCYCALQLIHSHIWRLHSSSSFSSVPTWWAFLLPSKHFRLVGPWQHFVAAIFFTTWSGGVSSWILLLCTFQSHVLFQSAPVLATCRRRWSM